MFKKNSIECWIYNTVKKSFLLLNCPATKRHRAYWQPVTGGIEKGETKSESCIREVDEETGVTVNHENLVMLIDSFGVYEKDVELHKTVFVYSVSDQKITISDEHEDYKWTAPEEVESLLLWESNKKTFREVTKHLGLL
jgi:8-oxo-dGTP pyrophosphatase MutT (NUDIX family)